MAKFSFVFNCMEYFPYILVLWHSKNVFIFIWTVLLVWVRNGCVGEGVALWISD